MVFSLFSLHQMSPQGYKLRVSITLKIAIFDCQ